MASVDAVAVLFSDQFPLISRMPAAEPPAETVEPSSAATLPMTVPVPCSVWPLTRVSVSTTAPLSRPVTSSTVLAWTSITGDWLRLLFDAALASASVPPLTVVGAGVGVVAGQGQGPRGGLGQSAGAIDRSHVAERHRTGN